MRIIFNHTKLLHGALFLALAFLTACGGGGGGGTSAPTYTIGGTVSGLTGTGLVLQNNGGDDRSISADGNFTFATPLAGGATYAVTVKTQPNGQVCSVNPYSGTVAAKNITTVAVTCAASSNTYTIGGTISGLTGSGLVLQNNGGDNLTVSSSATTFAFSTALASGTTYTVTVLTQPAGQTCTVNTPTNTGTVTTANISNVAVICSTASYTVGGNVAGLTGAGLVLQNNGGDNLTVSSSATTFTFSTALASGATYTVTVLTQPAGQTCTVNTPTNTGTVTTANISNVAVTCVTATTTYTIGGTISGLTGSGLVLQNNGGDNLTVSSSATTFAFSTALASGATYTVTVLTQPAGQTCTVNTPTNTGTVAAANISNVAVTCVATTTTYTIGGSVSGLTGAGLVLQDNGGDNLAISTDGTFVFATPHANSYVYYVTVLTQPAGQTCSVASGVGVVSGANVTVVSVTCATATYTIGGTISGLGTSTGLVLQNNGGDNLSVNANASSFTFGTALPGGTTYNVTVLTQPAGKTCTVNSPSGPVTSQNITSVSVICSTASYTVGGNVAGLTGSGLVLQNNGADDLTVAALAPSYTFTTPLASGSTYNVTVKTQPTSQVCTVANPTGPVTANVTNADVSCVNAYTIGGTITGAAAGIGPILQNNLGDNLFIPAITTGATNFTFSTPIADFTTYSVTQLIRARAPAQDCSAIAGGSGTVNGGPVSTVSITCALSAVVPRFAYVTNSTANTTYGAADTVSSFTIGGTGTLTAAITPTTASGDGPYAVAVDPTGQFAYVVNSYSDSVSAYGVDPGSGALSAIDANDAIAGSQPTIATGDNPKSIAIHPSGKFAYVANQLIGTPGTLSAYSINMASGALTSIDADAVTPLSQPTIATGTNPYAVTVDPLGKFAYVANYDSSDISAYTIDQTSGALTPVGTAVAAGTGPGSIAAEPTGKCILVANNTSENVMSYTIDSTTGALTLVSTVPGAAGSAPRSIAVDPNTGLYAYVANAGLSDVSAYSITLPACTIAAINAGAVGPALTIAAGSVPISINVDPSGQFVYVANFGSDNVSVYSIGAAGALTLEQTQATGSGPVSVTTTQ